MKKLHIHIPEHPYKHEITSFGRDEMVGLAFNTLGTVFINLILSNFGVAFGYLRKILLSFGGPVIEKIGFFVPHFIIQLRLQRKQNTFNLKKLLRYTFVGGSETLIKDILFHDPLYILLMMILQEVTPQTPIVLISFISFIGALLLVGFMKITFDELRYKGFCWRLEQKGFIHETYYESRIYMSTYEEAKIIFNTLIKHFALEKKNTREYTDVYHDSSVMNDIGGRTIKVRKRSRNSDIGSVHTGQIIFTKASELKISDVDQYRYFPIKKEKFAYKHDSLELLDQVLAPYKSTESDRVRNFTREYGHNPTGLLVTLDKVKTNDGYKFLIELKVHKDLKLLREAIRFVLVETKGEQHTHGKDDL